ncbi:MAG: cellulase [Alteromonas sp.]|nr:cellulase [Alteromonas sp.]|tara:strand:- start:17794 stop:19515 length:1722 start_codon:yes stop_codon:yes gene_type:complete
MSTKLLSFSKLAMSLSLVFAIGACSGVNSTSSTASSATPDSQAQPVEFYANQVGFLPQQQKHIVVRTSQMLAYRVTHTASGKTVLEGTTSSPDYWPLADQTVAIADVSSITAPGLYRLSLGDNDYTTFRISVQRVSALHDAAIKAYYYNRAGMALDPAFAGKWHRKAGHPDTYVLNLNQPQVSLASPKGWYDAGDYNKYSVNSGISTYTLMRAYLDFPAFYAQRRWNIPESTNNQPDLLDEINWNLDWMLTMQDSDGGVYHKLTTLNFAPAVMPAQATEQRYVVAKGTAASLNFAAVMATAARVYPQRQSNFLAAAKKAWQWALENPQMAYKNAQNVKTGEYGDSSFSDEFAWAASELFVTTGEQDYLSEAENYLGSPATPGWSDTMGLAYLSLLSEQGQNALPAERYQALKTRFLDYADALVKTSQASPFRTAMTANDFVWGSNGVAMNHAMVLASAFRLSNNVDYRHAFTGLVDYVLGKNPVGYSYVTGFGETSPRFIHHRQSHADGIAEPVPGFLVGGAQNGQQDNCQYSTSLPATSYKDNWCSYSTNEVTINWNAPLVYSLAAMITLTK